MLPINIIARFLFLDNHVAHKHYCMTCAAKFGDSRSGSGIHKHHCAKLRGSNWRATAGNYPPVGAAGLCMAQLGDTFSLSHLLSPLPGNMADDVMALLQTVPVPLAAPALQAIAGERHGIRMTDQASKNVVWKFQNYLPSLTLQGEPTDALPASLKHLQQLSPGTPLVRVSSRRLKCCCGHDLVCKAAVDHSVIPSNLPGLSTMRHDFKVFSLVAGVQLGSFEEKRCAACRRVYLGDWAYKREQGRFGHLSDIRYTPVSDTQASVFFVIPRYRSFYAVEIALLEQITDTLEFCSGSMQAAVILWGRRHKEPTQRRLIFGEDFTMLPHVKEDLLVAWYCWSAVSMSGHRAVGVEWQFTEGFDNCLSEHGPRIREAQIEKTAEHMRECPRCSSVPMGMGDGKEGARRLICAGTTGAESFPDLGVTFDTGCTRHATPRHTHCRMCRSAADVEHLISNQVRVVGTETVEVDDGARADMRFIVELVDPSDSARTVEVMLPGAEVQRSLLREYEESLLPRRTDHRNLRSQRQRIKGPRQFARWLKQRKEGCAPLSGEKGVASAPPRTGAKGKPGKVARRGRVAGPGLRATTKGKGRRRKTTVCRRLDEEPGGCRVDKEVDATRRRRTTGGIFTFVLTCGYLADWVELWRGERLELVYAFLLRVYRDLKLLGVVLQCIGYDNACKLLLMARARQDGRPPWSQTFARDIAIVLDNFHRGNHTWCLAHLPEVDPEQPRNAALMSDKNTEACEQLNSWISLRTRASLELPPGRFLIYWWTLFVAHNAWVESQHAAKRRRFARGGVKQDPDKPKRKKADI